MAETNALVATQAYSRALTGAAGAKIGGAAAGEDAANNPSFAQVLADAGGEAIKSGVASEQISLDAVTGNAGLADIVTAVSNAEATLETVVAVRDRVIQAYQDIIKMPI